MFRFKLLLIIIFSFHLSIAQAQQNSSLSGIITDSSGPLSGASVIFKGTKMGTTTNSSGYFEFTGVAPGTYTVVISIMGFETQQKQVSLKAGEKLNVNFSLKSTSQQMHDVNVTGKTATQQIKESGFAVNAIDTKKLANTTADLSQILNRSTGVRVREQGGLGSDFKFSINGLSGKQVKFFIDGIPMDVMGSAITLNNIPVNLADRLEVYKGVVPVTLGADAMGGAVNVITNQNVNNYLDVSHSYGSFATNRSALLGQFVDKKTGIVVKASGFFNYSKNNYLMKDVDVVVGGVRNGKEITDLNGADYVKADVRRFHDDYRSVSGQVEAGVTNKSWADVLFVGAGYNKVDQDLQTGFEQDIVYGMVTRASNAKNLTLRYKKDNLFTQGLSLTAFAAKSKDTYITIDTATRLYFWDGSYSPDRGTTEMNNIKNITHMVRPRTYAMANASYTINSEHSFNLNYTLDYLKNRNFNALVTDHDDMPGLLGKQIAGFAYQQDLLDKRLVNTAFVKYYHLGLERNKYINAVLTKLDTTFSNLGYGIATRYKILPDLGIKASFEHAYRLQEAEEMFGDGLNVQGNPDLRPENSDNVNLGAYYSFTLGKSRFFIEASGFYRNAQDFIAPLPDQRTKVIKNQNVSAVRITGFESELRYAYDQLITVNLNLTYQNAISTTQYGRTESINYESTYLNKLPNQPFLFGNADFTIGKDNLLGKNTRIQFNWLTQYVNWFYLTWEGSGSLNGKQFVPTQFIHNASVSYALQNGKYNLSAECRNLTDVVAFDNYSVQKPGRSFAVKLRYFIH